LAACKAWRRWSTTCSETALVWLGKLRLGTRIRELAVRLLGNGFERTGIDHIQKVAGLDEGAVAKLDAGDESADPGANLNLFDRFEPSGKFVPIRHGTFDGLGNRDGRCGGRGWRRRLIAATGQGDCDQNGQWPKIAERTDIDSSSQDSSS